MVISSASDKTAIYSLQINSAAPDAVSWVHKLKAQVSPHSSGYEFYNYFDCNTYKEDMWEAYFGPNAARLKEVKARYDPNNRLDYMGCGVRPPV
jgi:FAD/FMN-containing dehydrogenase